MELWQLQQLQSLPLDIKIKKTKLRIKEWYEYWDGQVYVSFSGGKDSTVLLHIVRELYPTVPAVFCDTGLEYPEIRDFVKTIDNVIWLKPEMNFKEVIEKYGYPVISKAIADYACTAQKNPQSKTAKMLRGEFKSMFGGRGRYAYLADAPFKISGQCCSVMKKRPMKKFVKETGRHPIIGTMASESINRRNAWLKNGCNAYQKSDPTSNPLSFWTEQDILTYLKTFEIPYSKIYGDIIYDEVKKCYKTTGLERSGCMFCMFGCHLEKEPNRFQRMKITHPQLYQYCMKPWSDGGLGLAEVLDFINVPYGDYIPQLKDYEQIKLC